MNKTYNNYNNYSRLTGMGSYLSIPRFIGGFLGFCLLAFSSCKKLLEIPPPKDTITVDKLFVSDATADAAVSSIYSQMENNNPADFGLCYSNGSMTIDCAALTGELNINDYSQFAIYELLPTDGYIGSLYWSRLYSHIYQANAVIENLAGSSAVSANVKARLTGEAKFIRAFAHFYLVNLYGDVPIVTQSEWSKINLIGRSPADSVYNQIIRDLKDAQDALPDDYSAGGGEKIRANKWAATALLARVYLYRGDWVNAEAQTNLVINSGKFTIMTDPTGVFIKNSDEAILQWQVPNVAAAKYATVEGNKTLPTSHTSSAVYVVSDELLAAFEPDDLRRKDWVDSTIFRDIITYYYPAKYKVKVSTANNVSEYYMVLRYAEQFLIRAEARANLGTNLAGAIADVNVIRERAQLPDLDPTLSKPALLTAIAKERQIEFFVEWGHRWFDLKRTGQTDAVLGSRPNWRPEIKLWPIPASELTADPNLTQNPGYN